MKLSKKTITVTAVIVILLITNPNYTKFNNFSKEIETKNSEVVSKISVNGFLFSVYSKEIAHTKTQLDGLGGYKGQTVESIETVKYLGILSNFFELSRNIQNVPDHPYLKK